MIGVRAAAAGADEIEPQIGADRSVLFKLTDDDGRKRGPGRPKGSKNKASEQLRNYLLAKYRDPLDGLGEIVSTPIPELARLLKCTRLDAAAFWLRALAEFGPYVHQRQPQALNLDPGAAIPLFVNLGAAVQLGLNPTEFGLDMRLVNGEANQQVSTPQLPQSDGGSRTDGAK